MGTSRAKIEIVNSDGLHLRAAQRFAQVAQRFRSKVIVARDDQSADGKSILDLITMAATRGTALDIGAEGPDSEATIAALAALVESGFDGVDGAGCG